MPFLAPFHPPVPTVDLPAPMGALSSLLTSCSSYRSGVMLPHAAAVLKWPPTKVAVSLLILNELAISLLIQNIQIS